MGHAHAHVFTTHTYEMCVGTGALPRAAWMLDLSLRNASDAPAASASKHGRLMARLNTLSRDSRDRTGSSYEGCKAICCEHTYAHHGHSQGARGVTLTQRSGGRACGSNALRSAKTVSSMSCCHARTPTPLNPRKPHASAAVSCRGA